MALTETRFIRKGRIEIAYVPETADRVFWQLTDRGIPCASGIWGMAEAEAHLAGRIAAGFRITR